MLACSLLINIIKSRCKPNFVGKEEEEAKQREKMLYALSIKHNRKASMQKNSNTDSNKKNYEYESVTVFIFLNLLKQI